MSREMVLPILPLRGFIVFPRQIVNFDVRPQAALKALETAVGDGSEVLLGIQKNASRETPDEDGLWDVVMSMRVNKLFKEEDKSVRVLGEVLRRYRLLDFRKEGRFYAARVEEIEEAETDPVYEMTLCRALKESFEKFANQGEVVPHAVFTSMSLQHAGDLADLVAANIPLEQAEQLDLFLATDPIERAKKVLGLLDREINIQQMRQKLHSEVGQEIREIQKEQFLREEMALIRRQLGEDEEYDEVDPELDAMAADPEIPQVVREKIQQEVKRLYKMPPMSQEYGVIQDYLDRVKQVPWKKEAEPDPDPAAVRHILDSDHYGMERIKERIEEFVAVRKINPEIKAPVICLVGPPGVGKTSVASSIARALGRPYVRVSLGGVRDEAEIRGHRRTYIGSMPGRIISALCQAGSSHPLMLLDEVDKMASDLRGDPTAALLEVLDTSLNTEFRDAYMELPVDLSHVFFLTTANTLESIPIPLIDRMEIIELESYSRQEKAEIAMKYLLPRQRRENGLKASQLKINRRVMEQIIADYTREAGVRELERLIGSLCRKAAMHIVEGKNGLTVTLSNLAGLMDEPPMREDEEKRSAECGVVNGLAWTSMGGEVLTIETAILSGSGRLELTGQMGDVMKESAQIALSVARKYSYPGRTAAFYKENDVHLHIPAGAVPKDGPSAGVTMATAMVSALSGIPVRGDVAMTGEVSLRGRVLPIGGLKEKLLAARQRGLFEVIVPELNRKDVEKLHAHITEGMTIRYVEKIEQVLDIALVGGFSAKEAEPAGSSESETDRR